ncbi:DUF1064 domain-containing protein [Clostridium sp.]|uniref:DUF1064 domain-containing protein n=1 Tax=Clostridium sp. TaxID=1506 RepID=UPI0029159DB6|nr:DUF1064 domain-containing protein [Clostridium sp.]MDU3410115.1 DUF1064 domain-containing protein [Clostridium sp.]
MAKYNKYRNIKVEEDGFKFDSKVERDYYLHIKDLKSKGIVEDFKMQEKYLLQEKFKYKNESIREINYMADFVVLYSDGHEEVVDIKGSLFSVDSVFKVKRKLLIHRYPEINFKVVVRKGKKGSYVWENIM